jgi:hypothetical protein
MPKKKFVGFRALCLEPKFIENFFSDRKPLRPLQKQEHPEIRGPELGLLHSPGPERRSLARGHGLHDRQAPRPKIPAILQRAARNPSKLPQKKRHLHPNDNSPPQIRPILPDPAPPLGQSGANQPPIVPSLRLLQHIPTGPKPIRPDRHIMFTCRAAKPVHLLPDQKSDSSPCKYILKSPFSYHIP